MDDEEQRMKTKITNGKFTGKSIRKIMMYKILAKQLSLMSSWAVTIGFLVLLLSGPGYCQPRDSPDSEVKLESIAFDFSRPSNNVLYDRAIHLRKNEDEAVSLPEWEAGDAAPKDAPVAYAIRGSQNSVWIRVKFKFSPQVKAAIEVRAIPCDPVAGTILGGNDLNAALLGWVDETPIAPSNSNESVGNEPVKIDIQLRNVNLTRSSVGIHDIAWQWQYRTSPRTGWKNLALSKHRVYTVVNTPQQPWTNAEGNISNNVWTDVLDWACVWAKGLRREEEVAGSITKHVYQLGTSGKGEPNLTYLDPIRDSRGNIIPQYSVAHDKYEASTNVFTPARFFCSAFLRRLTGQPSRGRGINCYDCAAIVATFANAVGCDLRRVTLRTKRGALLTNSLLLIGQSSAASASWGSHEVVYMANRNDEDDNDDTFNETSLIFDACLQLNSNEDPTGVPFNPLPVTGLSFGTASDKNGYLYRLSAAPENIIFIMSPNRPIIHPEIKW